jgi:hypothetical protein
MRLTMGLNLEAATEVFVASGNDITFNLAPTLMIEESKSKELIETQLRRVVHGEFGAVKVNLSQQVINDDFGAQVGRPELTLPAIDRLRSAIATFLVFFHQSTIVDHWLPANYPKTDVFSQRCVLRYGNVELQALESYLEFPDLTQKALFDVMQSVDDEAAMYAPGRQKNHLSGDDIHRNIRKLITNAGFYAGGSHVDVWNGFVHWAEAYKGGLKASALASYPPAYPFYFKTQRLNWESDGAQANYVAHPNAFEFYEMLAGKRVLFVSPLAHLASEQVTSGRIRRLYKDYETPEFNVVGLAAPLSTWPNRPDKDWLTSYNRMCATVDEQCAAQSFDVFVASCGCYGVPVCSYVAQKHSLPCLYLGNITNNYFGILQNATLGVYSERRNEEMWVKSDLGRYANVAQIDGGRYV